METLTDSLNRDKADLWIKSEISEASEILAHAIRTKNFILTFHILARNLPRKLAHTFNCWPKARRNTYPRKTSSFRKVNSR